VNGGVTLRVSAKSNPNAVAGALAAVLRETNQAIKAVAIARSYLRGAKLDVVCVPSFVLVAIEESERTAISLRVERRSLEDRLEERMAQVEG
jgi:stage V sporulation protein S